MRRFITVYAPVCTATEVVSPAGYSADESDCENMMLTDDATLECDIINTQNPIVVSITKSYENPQPDVDPEVAITLTCPTGTVAPSATVMTSGGLATFEVSNFPFDGETCVATEELIRSYIQVDAAGCEDLIVSPGVNPEPSCTFLNGLDPESIFIHGFEN